MNTIYSKIKKCVLRGFFVFFHTHILFWFIYADYLSHTYIKFDSHVYLFFHVVEWLRLASRTNSFIGGFLLSTALLGSVTFKNMD